MKKLLISVGVIIVFLAGFYLIKQYAYAPAEKTPTPASPSTSKTDEIRARVQAKVTGENHVSINVTEVTEDSRCPQGVMCIQAGTVKLKATVGFLNQRDTDYDFELNKEVQTSFGRLTLISAEPAKKEGSNIPLSEYVFTFKITLK